MSQCSCPRAEGLGMGAGNYLKMMMSGLTGLKGRIALRGLLTGMLRESSEGRLRASSGMSGWG